MKYAQQTLGEGEKIISAYGPSKWLLFAPYTIGLFFISIPYEPDLTYGLGMIIVIWYIVASLTTNYVIRNKKGLVKKVALFLLLWFFLFSIITVMHDSPILPSLGATIMVWYTIFYLTTEYVVTNKKVLMKRGFIFRRTDELYIKKLEGVDVDQSILGRILGFGNLIFSGTGSQKVVFEIVPEPLKQKIQAQDLFDKMSA